MSQVIYRSQIKKYQNAPGPLPENETEEQRRKRLEEEARRNAAAGTQNAATGTAATTTSAPAATSAASAPAASTNAAAPAATPAATTGVSNGFFEQNGVRVTGDKAIEEINKKFINISDKTAQTQALGVIANGGGIRIMGNKVWFYDKDGKDITATIVGQKPFAKTRFGRSWAETFNTGSASNLRSYNALIAGSVTPEGPAKPEKPATTSLLYGKDWFSYDTDKDGNKVYNRSSRANQQIFDTMRDAVAALWDENYSADKYDLGKYANDVQYIQALKDNFGGIEGFNTYLRELEARAANQTLTDDDLRTLALFGYKKPGAGSSGGSDSGEGGETPYVVPDDLKGNADAFQKAGVVFTKGENGDYTLKGGIFGENGDVNWSLAGMDLFKGTKYENGFYHKGKLYTLDEVAANDQLGTTFRPFLTAGANGANWNTMYDAMNNSGVRFMGDRISVGENSDYYGGYTMYDPTKYYAKEYDAYFRNQRNGLYGAGIKDITGEYNLGAGKKLFAVANGQDAYGRPIVKYVLFDGQKTTQLNNLDSLASARKSAAYRTATGVDWGRIDKNGYASLGQFVTQSPGKARQTNGLMYNPITGKYSVIVNYDPNVEGAKGYDIDPSYADEILKYIKSGQIWKIDFNGNLKTFRNPRIDKATRENNPKSNGLAAIGDLAYKKNGGTIDWNRLQKLQSGGAFAGPTAKAKISETKDLQHDISKTHTVDEGFTESEKLRLGAAVADLTGMVMSFSQVAAPVGAAIGVGGTAAQFAADVQAQKEGRDVGHYVWRGLGNLALDAVSAIPLAGNAAKIFKVGKGLQKIAPILAKAMRFAAPTLGAVGLANATTALGKIVDGKWSELTSNDFVDLLNGISAATGGGAVVRQSVKDARALSKLSETAQTAAKDSKAIKSGKVGETIFDKKTGEILESLDGAKTKKEALDKIKDLVKEQNASLDGEALDNAAQSVFDALGLKSKSGRKHIKRDGWRFSRKAGEDVFELGDLELPKGTSMLNEMLNPKRIWMRDENMARAMAGLSAREINAANEAVRTRRYNPNSDTETMGLSEWLRTRDMQQAIARTAAANPQVFRDVRFAPDRHVGGNILGNRWNMGYSPFGANEYRMAIGSTPRTSSLGRSQITSLRRGLFDNADAIKNYNWDRVVGLENYLNNTPALREYFRKNPKSARNAIQKLVESWYPKGSVDYTNIMNALNRSTAFSGFGVKFKEGGEIPKFDDGGGLDVLENGKKYKINMPAFLDLTSAIAQSAAIGKSYDKQREAANLMKLATKTSPRIQGTRFDVSPIDRQVEEAIDPYRQVQFNSSDNRENMAGELQRAKVISDIRERGGQQKTAAIDKFNEVETNRANAQAAQDAKVADENRALSAQADATLKQLDAQELSDKWASVWNVYSNQRRQEFRDAANKLSQGKFDELTKLDEMEFARATEAEFATLKGEWANDPDKGNMDFLTWVASDPTRKQRYDEIANSEKMQGLKNEYIRKRTARLNELYTMNPGMLYYKTGGKVEKKTSNKQQLTVNDRLTLQGDKAAKRAVLQASNNLHKMLLKLMK